MFRAKHGCRIVWQPLDMTDQMDWDISLSGTIPTSGGLGRPWLIVIGYGLKTNGVGSLTVDYVANYEGQFKQQGFLPGGIGLNTSSPSEIGWYETMQRYLCVLDPITANVQAVVSNAANAASPAVGAALGNAVGARLRAVASPARQAALPWYQTVD